MVFIYINDNINEDHVILKVNNKRLSFNIDSTDPIYSKILDIDFNSELLENIKKPNKNKYEITLVHNNRPIKYSYDAEELNKILELIICD